MRPLMITVIRKGLELFLQNEKSRPKGSIFEVTGPAKEKGYLKSDILPICPMNGRPYSIEYIDGKSRKFRIGCPNHGWLPSSTN